MKHITKSVALVIAFAAVVLVGGIFTAPMNTAFASSHEVATILSVGVFAFFSYALMVNGASGLPCYRLSLRLFASTIT